MALLGSQSIASPSAAPLRNAALQGPFASAAAKQVTAAVWPQKRPPSRPVEVLRYAISPFDRPAAHCWPLAVIARLVTTAPGSSEMLDRLQWDVQQTLDLSDLDVPKALCQTLSHITLTSGVLKAVEFAGWTVHRQGRSHGRSTEGVTVAGGAIEVPIEVRYLLLAAVDDVPGAEQKRTVLCWPLVPWSDAALATMPKAVLMQCTGPA